jgi:hypothetical protein
MRLGSLNVGNQAKINYADKDVGALQTQLNRLATR